VEVGVQQHVVVTRCREPLQFRAGPVGAEVAHRHEPVARRARAVQPRRQLADQHELLLPAGAAFVHRRSGLQSLQQQREAVVARAEHARHRAGLLPEREGVALARELGVVAVAARVELEHPAIDPADQRDATAAERLELAQPPVLDRGRIPLAHVRRQLARIALGPELSPVGRQSLQRLYENGSGSTALGILISGGP
jgi:hypothetical protein